MSNPKSTTDKAAPEPLAPPELLDGQHICERADAARNRELLLDAAKRLIDRDGAAAVSMDAVAREAGVGKGTVFRRFGTRAGLMHALLNQDELEFQHAFIAGPPPLGPGGPPRSRLIAFGRARLNFVTTHLDVLRSAESNDTSTMEHPAYRASALHVRMLLQQIGFKEPTPLLVTTVLAPLQPQSAQFLLSGGATLSQIADDWEALVRSLQP